MTEYSDSTILNHITYILPEMFGSGKGQGGTDGEIIESVRCEYDKRNRKYVPASSGGSRVKKYKLYQEDRAERVSITEDERGWFLLVCILVKERDITEIMDLIAVDQIAGCTLDMMFNGYDYLEVARRAIWK